VKPALDKLPVFVRGGSILPIAPVVQSTNEMPQGALTLRVYAGDACTGELYQDDGKTYAYQHGGYLRMQFSCTLAADSLHIKIGAHEGSHPAWWKEIRVEVYGWKPTSSQLAVNGKRVPQTPDRQAHSISFTIADDGRGVDVELR
jgi:alpha-glucosidase